MADEALLLTVPEAAQQLHWGRDHTYRLIAEGKLPAIRFGRTIRVPRRGLEDFIARAQSENALAAQG
jgi:excisionase family DNA binding protein